MVELGYNQTGKQYCISRFKGNQKHKGIDKVEIVTCLIETDVWHFNKLIDYIIDTRLVLRSQINHPLRLSARDSDPIRNISHWIELKDDE
jgi:hypothetical protein